MMIEKGYKIGFLNFTFGGVEGVLKGLVFGLGYGDSYL
jgi:hypothetical protein